MLFFLRLPDRRWTTNSLKNQLRSNVSYACCFPHGQVQKQTGRAMAGSPRHGRVPEWRSMAGHTVQMGRKTQNSCCLAMCLTILRPLWDPALLEGGGIFARYLSAIIGFGPCRRSVAVQLNLNSWWHTKILTCQTPLKHNKQVWTLNMQVRGERSTYFSLHQSQTCRVVQQV